MGFSGSGAVSGAAAGTAIMPGWGTLAGGVLGGLFGGSPEAQNTPAPMPTNYYGMNGSGMFYNPATGGYTSLDPRMSGADSGALMKYQQMIDSLTGGKNTVSSYAKQQADQLKTQINDPKTPAAMKQELQARLNTLNQSAQNTGDWQNPLGAIGVTDPNRQLEFQKQTGTVQDYLKSTLDSSMNQRALGENSALASEVWHLVPTLNMARRRGRLTTVWPAVRTRLRPTIISAVFSQQMRRRNTRCLA